MAIRKSAPMRKCVGCNERFEKKQLIRVVRTPEMEVKVDAGRKMNGRGAYLCRSSACFRKAIKNRGIERALEVSLPEEIITVLEEEIEQLERK